MSQDSGTTALRRSGRAARQSFEPLDSTPIRKRKHVKRPKSLPAAALKILEDETASLTATAQIRLEIKATVAARNRFLLDHKELFLNLLPARNFIQKLEERNVVFTPSKSSPSGFEAVAANPSYERIEQPKGMTATLKPYQLSGLSFLVYMFRCGMPAILGDEMGLGKTIQTLALFQYIKENVPATQGRPALVVCPLSILGEWINEAKKWVPELKAVRFHGPMAERSRLKETTRGLARKGECDIVVTSFETFAADKHWFQHSFIWQHVVLDEGHKIKNDTTQISRSLAGLHCEHKLILSGTPLQNNLGELWALLHWLYPDVFTQTTKDRFLASFDLTKGKVDPQTIVASKKLLEVIMMRRMKGSPGVNLNLPPKTDVLLYMPLTPMQRFWYKFLLSKTDRSLTDQLFKGVKGKAANDAKAKEAEFEVDVRKLAALSQHSEDRPTESRDELEGICREGESEANAPEQSKSNYQRLLNLLMQLRKVCSHPYLVAGGEDLEFGEHIVEASIKLIVLDKMLGELVFKQKKKIIIFSGFTSMLDYVEDFLCLRGGNGQRFRYCRLDGRTARARRNLGVRLFQDVNSGYDVMLVSTKAGGLGLNLTAATEVILLDQDWNPQNTLQAEARAHRIGQKKPVTVYKFCTAGTVEEQMMGRIQKKLYLSAKVTESMVDRYTLQTAGEDPMEDLIDDEDAPNLGASQLMSYVRRGAQTLARPEIDVDEMLSWDWQTTVDKCKDKAADYTTNQMPDTAAPMKKEDLEREEKAWLSQMEQVESYLFDGQQYSRKNASVKDIKGEWLSREARRQGKNTTVMVNGYAVSKESMKCGDWEAVPTLAGKDPSLAEPKGRSRTKIENESHCIICFDGGEIFCCEQCPRSFHYDCVNDEMKARTKKFGRFVCMQHQCFDCDQKTCNAGGMLYRCRWCDRGFCEDCADWGNTKLLGATLPEYEMLGFGEVDQAFYIECSVCNAAAAADPKRKAFINERREAINDEHRVWTESAVSSRPESMVPDVSGVSTPKDDDPPTPKLAPIKIKLDLRGAKGKKRAAAIEEEEKQQLVVGSRRSKRSRLSEMTSLDG